MDNNADFNERMYCRIRQVPIIGAIFRIVNAYAYQGDSQCNKRVAPFFKWWQRVFKKSVYIIFLVELIVVYYQGDVSKIPWKPDDSILSVFPSVLGFGIGVFALLFVMPESFLVFMSTNKKRLTFGPEIVPVDIAYPLVIFTIALCWSVLNKVFTNDFFSFVSMFLFFYGMTMAFELISFLFNSSLLIQKISLSEYKRVMNRKKEEERVNRWRKRSRNMRD